MNRIPQAFIDDLLSRVDIVSVVDRRVKLKRAGKNYSACCPFHQEKTPSFTVSPDKQFFYCFGCGASGNAIGFVMEYERQSFIDSIESLAQDLGIEVPKEESKQLIQQDFRRKKLFDVLESANAFYQKQLKEHPQKHHAVKYLQGRGLSGHIARDFNLGFAPPTYDALLKALGTNEELVNLLIDAGLVIHKAEENKTYDRFRNRIIFPIRDERGRIIGFGGRVLGDDKPKYLNSPETEVFHKGRELYGLYEAKKAVRKLESLIVVEGYMDVIAMAQYGISNAVATLGTACGEEHLKLAFRFVNDIIFCFDGDNAGRSAAKRALLNSLSSMEDGRQIRFLFLPEGQDPDSLVRQIGTDRFLAQVQQAVPLEEFLFDVAAEGIDINNMGGRAKFSKIAAPLIAKLPPGIFSELMFGNLARRTGLSREVLLELQNEKIRIDLNEDDATKEATKETPTLRDVAPIENSTHLDNPHPPSKQSKTRHSRIELSPTKRATILLLEHPELLKKLDEKPELGETNDPDCLRLQEIIRYLEKRPESNFSNILGFWGGSKGLEQQQELAELMANQLFNSVKSISSYDALAELKDALAHINTESKKQSHREEIAALKARGLSNLTEEEKNRLITLTRS